MTEPRIYRASSLGYSLCQLVNPHLGYLPLPPPPFLQEAFDEGRRLEQIVVDQLRESLDCWIDYQGADDGSDEGRKGERVTLDVIPGVAQVVGHLDGRIRITSNGPEKILEIKTMNPRTWEKFFKDGLAGKDKLLEKYRWQVSGLMLAAEMPCTVVGYNKETGQLARTTLTEPPYLVSDIAKKLHKAESYIAKGIIPDGCNEFPCSFAFLHAPKDEAEPADEEVDNLLALWLEADKSEKVFKAEKDRLKAQIVALAGEKAAKVRGSQGVTVSTYWQKEAPVSGYMKKAGWVTSISAPKVRKVEDA